VSILFKNIMDLIINRKMNEKKMIRRIPGSLYEMIGWSGMIYFFNLTISGSINPVRAAFGKNPFIFRKIG